MKLVVGLGNPGRTYARTRHNVGFDVVERLAARWSIDPNAQQQLGALVGGGRVGDATCILARPQSFMNRSGHPTASLAGHLKLSPEDVIVVHDDLDLAFGQVRCKSGGGHGGHNGLRDIADHLGKDFLRVRFGVGRPPAGMATADYVLGAWNEAEAPELHDLVERSCDAVEAILSDGINAAMNRFNVRPRPNAVDELPQHAEAPSPGHQEL